MALPVPDDVFCEYNGYAFPSNVRTRVEETPIESGDGRNIKYSKIRITFAGYITHDDSDGQPIDTVMLEIRRALQANGKYLRYTSKGYGIDLDVNNPAGGGVRDVAMGPKAGRYQWWPLGGAPAGCHGAGFSWEVSFCIPECGQARFTPGPGVFSEVSYTVGFDTDEAGLVTVTTRGKAEIPLSLQNGRLTANIDEYIADLFAPPSAGFIRRVNRELSPDRGSCTFTITDRQLEVPPPHDVVHIDMKHKIRQKTRSDRAWTATISGTLRLSPTANKFLAWQRFYAIAFARILASGEEGVSRLPPKIEMEEDLFKNEARFSITYDFVGTSHVDVIRHSGLWQPVQPTGADRSWTAVSWAESLRDNAQKFKGIIGASFPNASDVIIDVCTGGQTQNEESHTPEISPDAVITSMDIGDGTPRDQFEPVGFTRPGEGGSNPDESLPDQGAQYFDPEFSWINWHCEVERITDYNQIRHKPLAGVVQILPPNIDPLGPAQAVAADFVDPQPGFAASVPDIIQQTASPSMALRLRGLGVRIAYRVNTPKLISFGGVTPVLAHETVRESTLGAASGVVYYKTEWDLVYLLPSSPNALPIPANPHHRIDGH